MQTHRHQADILIIGGGVCGLNAALTAREQGRSVIVMDKAVIERSGHIAGGIDHFLAYMNTGAEWDTREAYLEFTGKSARGVTNIDVVDSVYCQELPHALKRFEEINCTLRQPDGTYYRTKSYGQPRPVVDQLQRQEDEASPRQGRPQGRVRRARPRGHRRSAHQRRYRLRRGGLRYPHGRFPYHPRRGGHHLHGRHQPPLQQPFRHELQHMDVPRRHRRRRSHEPARRRGTRQHRIPAHDRGAPQLQRRRAQRPLRHGGRAHQRQG